jgi:hypothetical protein
MAYHVLDVMQAFAAGLVQPQDLIGEAIDVDELAVRGTIDTVDGEQYRRITRKAKPRVHGWSPDWLATCGGVRQWAGGRTLRSMST